MALTVVKRPRGYKLQTASTVAGVSNSGGDALFETYDLHGLITGDFVYIYSVRSAYNGLWYVEVISTRSFKIREYAAASFEDFMATGNVTYYKSFGEANGVCVHQPMVYKLTSDKWPVNSVDTARTVSSFSNSNGYTQITLSGDLKASGSASALEQVKISGTVSLDGIYRILTWNSDVNVVIDLTYASTNVFTGGTVQYYYGNYHAIIQVYAGIHPGYYWEPYKPYELVATFSQQPDPQNIVAINVNEFVKKKINILENNLLLDTLPNNVDAFCDFYIAVAESYDDANQYGTNNLNVTEYISPFVSDTFCVAINCKLPFKSRAVSSTVDYTLNPSTGAAAKWLTSFTRPTLFVGMYFDLSFILNDSSPTTIQRKVYDSSGTLLNTFTDVITNMDKGVYRQPIEQSLYLEAYMTVQLINSLGYVSEILTIDVDSTCSAQDFYLTWLNNLGGFDYWNFQGETAYGISTIESKTQQKNIYTGWPNSYGEFVDSIEKQTSRRTKDTLVLNSKYVDNEYGKFDALVTMLESPLVQKVNSIYDKRTILLGNSSQSTKVDNQKLLMLTVEARDTAENPSQSL